MSEEEGAERPRAVWSDPRYRDVVARWARHRTERRPGRRPRRVCPHGLGVTLTVDLATRKPFNVGCAACNMEG
ncbi:hypothetical protein [Streptomyces sp. NPDC059991]|uniref:hypothetical protein n=1 Tax=unclassified Streptomyces TaxID=2593676 RepID=UPI00369EC025